APAPARTKATTHPPVIARTRTTTRQPVTAPPRPRPAMCATTDKVVATGASTGGTEALLAILREMPVDCPGIVVVQHMPEKFTAQFAARLGPLCERHVTQAGCG